MWESARMTVGFCALALSSPSSKLRAPTYVNSVPRKVMSATCCIVALSSTHKTILLTWDPPQSVWDCRETRPPCRLHAWSLVARGSPKGQFNCRESVGLLASPDDRC